ncbi:iron-containing alcohol dehydrogenase [Hydrogenophilus thiooxidans]|uniref:iron-containing alcohol dehydrogenase n=1 Tax=Hydrogenophilus thiooxidans TaxID=2820326 RepID=UPI001C22042B|nr:iron-containing alcohol dehydrogenase [Hydrogenophilus thiooxidans]
MNNFYSYNPTKIIFGRGSISLIRNEMKNEKKILLLCGKESIKKNGVLEQIRKALQDKEVIEFFGIEQNPDIETCMKALEIARKENIEFILAAGGGSVIDAAKYIALAFYYEKKDPWQILLKNETEPNRVLPFGCIQTVPGSGTEFNNAFVLSNRSKKLKISFYSHKLYPRFSVLDPETTFTLSQKQTAFGIVDMFVHVLEQYITWPRKAPLQDRLGEALLVTIKEIAHDLLANPNDYELRATSMWCAAQAASGQLSRGVPTDWATHFIGHEITALYDLTHAQTLALILGGVWEWNFEYKKKMLAQYANRVWGMVGDEDLLAKMAIIETDNFFESLGVPTRFSSLSLDAKKVAADVISNLSKREFTPLGENRSININAIKEIILSRS